MWKRLSLRARLFLPLSVLFLTALLIGSSALEVFSPSQFVYENEPESQAVRVVAAALNGALRSSENPQQVLDAFAGSLGTTAVIQFRRTGTGEGPPTVRTDSDHVPKWFVDMLAIPELGAAYPVLIDDRHVGDILFVPDISADVFEKWAGFLAIVLSAAILMALTAGVAYFIAGGVLRPLVELGSGLTRMRGGRYDEAIPVAGPPEIQRSCMEANELAATLSHLQADNRDLLHRIVSLQDNERQHLARELHDEMGPLLFSIRASSIFLLDRTGPESRGMDRPLQDILQAVEALQAANRRILEGLHPLYLDYLGLSSSIRSLIDNVKARNPELRFVVHLDPVLDEMDGPISHTIYRVLQEALTNVLRHSGARSVEIGARVDGSEIIVEVADDGMGLAPAISFGRGLAGMRERARALGGTFDLVRQGIRTVALCRLPISVLSRKN